MASSMTAPCLPGTGVAIKCMYNDALTENAELFEKEIEMMRQLHHPNIVQFLGFAVGASKQLVIVMVGKMTHRPSALL